ncbi:MAG: DUF1622 domain-containing protein [Bradyrhizobium sp.]|jgi:uncharacterized membrane protein|uniref:DUF1622 domain-containing protein n=1 Tax=Bradyrhizobium sp. TaxID=376 RepID=UPI001A2E1095|nr:DUF1622 domain-containing protein [Bradyrhizobium sp.]MBJ7404310.1 DUF1622 domain-containing protein [Bradyrhizobium sp.]
MLTSELVLSTDARAIVLHTLHWIAAIVEVLGVGVIVVAVIAASAWSIPQMFLGEWRGAFRSYRANLGRGILLGLEFLIAADIIGMVAIVPTLERLAVLGLIIVIRTFLSFSLQIEIDGRLPWRRERADAADSKDGGL